MFKMLRFLLLSYSIFLSLAQATILPAPVHPMVPMFHLWDYEKAPERIARAAAAGTGRVSFTILELVELNADLSVRNFGATWPAKNPEGKVEHLFQPMTEEIRQGIGTALRSAFREAVKHQLAITVLPMVDATGKVTEWRNFFDLDPVRKIGGFSYETALLNTVLEALEDSVPAGHRVEMALEGEMGRSLFSFPESWLAILNRIRERGKLPNLRLGISANYEGVAGKIQPDASQRVAMNRLIAACDFVGISCYAKAGHPPQVADFTACCDQFCLEFANLGCPIPFSKPLRFTELGHGGGGFDEDWKITVPAPLVDRMGKAAYFGTHLPGKNPWKSPLRMEFRRAWYAAALEFLKSQPARWRVEHAYLWSFGSWDVQGIADPEFQDPVISEMIRKHHAETGKMPGDNQPVRQEKCR